METGLIIFMICFVILFFAGVHMFDANKETVDLPKVVGITAVSAIAAALVTWIASC